MTAGWNFERRRDTCARFLLGVSLLAKGAPEFDTSLEAVRHRVGLSPEEALFAARRLDEEQLIAFEPAGPVRSNARGIARASALVSAQRTKAQRFREVLSMLRANSTELAVLAAVLQSEGGSLACGAPDEDPERSYRLALVDSAVTLERLGDDGAFAPAALDAPAFADR